MLDSTTRVHQQEIDQDLVASTQDRFKINNLFKTNFKIQCQESKSIDQLQTKEEVIKPSDPHQWLIEPHHCKQLKLHIKCNKLQLRVLHKVHLWEDKLHQ